MSERTSLKVSSSSSRTGSEPDDSTHPSLKTSLLLASMDEAQNGAHTGADKFTVEEHL